MAITGYAVLSDNSRVAQTHGITGFGYDVESNGTETLPGFVIVDSTTLNEKGPFYQNQILGPGDLPLCLTNWGYYGGYQQLDGTWVGGSWMNRWYDPMWLWYSVWYENYIYDSSGHETGFSPYTLVGYKYRDPTRKNVGNYYASMVVPKTVGHYEVRWVYEKDNSSYAHEVIVPFVDLSLGVDSMVDYPIAQPPISIGSPNEDPVGNDTPVEIDFTAGDLSTDSPDLSEGGSYG
jgi:hypothetical protein